MKELLFAAYSLDIGWNRKVTSNIDKLFTKKRGYQITIILEKKTGDILEGIKQRYKSN